MNLHLTDLTVQRLREPGTYFDDATPGFGVRVGKNRKTWIVMRGQIRQRVRIGHYPGMPLAQARKLARTLLIEPAKKHDRLTFEAGYDLFKAHVQKKKPRTQAEYKRLIEKHFLPKLRSKRLVDLDYEDVTACVEMLPKGEAAHALAVARIFFRWCVRPPRRYIPHNPLEGLEIAKPKKRKRTLDALEIPVVWKAAGRQGYPHGTLVQLLLLNGQRRNETANLRWPWINENERTITLPDWITKNSKEHVFPYGDMTAQILDTIPRLNSTNLLFPSRVSDERPISGWSKFKREMDEGLTIAHYTLHDLRRTFRTLHGQIGTPSSIGERLINHAAAVVTDVEEIYDRYGYLKEMREAVANFEVHLKHLLARAA